MHWWRKEFSQWLENHFWITRVGWNEFSSDPSCRYQKALDLLVDPATKKGLEGVPSTFPRMVITIGQLVLPHPDKKDLQ